MAIWIKTMEKEKDKEDFARSEPRIKGETEDLIGGKV